MRTLEEIFAAFIPDSHANQMLRLLRERPTNHPGSKRHHEERKAKTRRKMAARSQKINRRHFGRHWSH